MTRLPTHEAAVATRAAAARTDSQEVELDVAREMRRRWRAGQYARAEEYLADHPELWQRPEDALELVYEEFCLRTSAGDASAEQDILRRFPNWSGPLRLMMEFHDRVLELGREEPHYPGSGEHFEGFLVVAELARGGRGRVFLATDTALSDRAVVLKITPLDDGAEHLSLARLQHTNIVPLYSVVDDAERRTRTLCMPYVGHTTLASLLAWMSGIPSPQRSGRDVLAAIDAGCDPRFPPAVGFETTARELLSRASYLQAACWIVATLADALHFAHERGVVHLDLKPSNVLLAHEGQPMLLDFHLAREPVVPRRAVPEHFGGTPPYMSPEQHEALRSIGAGRTPDVAVDRRADVYAIGAMLYEWLGGQLPMAAGSPPLDEINPQVSTGLSDIVAKCVEWSPDKRYADAAMLADDLKRHLADEPLVGVANRRVRERWEKWRRRRPGALRAAAMLLALLAIGGLLLATWGRHLGERRDLAELALADARRQAAAGRYAEAVRSAERGGALAADLPFQKRLRQSVAEQLASSRRRQLQGQLHEVAEQVRELYGADESPSPQLHTLADECAELWRKRDTLTETPQSTWAPAVAADLRDIAVIAADLFTRLSERDRAARLLDESEAQFGSDPVIDHERRVHQIARGLTPSVERRSDSTRSVDAQAWEHTALGRAALAAGDLPFAARELNAAVELDPAGRWPNFYAGVCAYRAGHNDAAIAAFSVFIGADPDNSVCYFNRALAYAAMGNDELALRDYDYALRLNPAFGAASVNRAMLHYRAGRLHLALADLQGALTAGAEAATVHYNLALVHLASNDRAAALREARLAIDHAPRDVHVRELCETIERHR